jgi:hypothetical protein
MSLKRVDLLVTAAPGAKQDSPATSVWISAE